MFLVYHILTGYTNTPHEKFYSTKVSRDSSCDFDSQLSFFLSHIKIVNINALHSIKKQTYLINKRSVFMNQRYQYPYQSSPRRYSGNNFNNNNRNLGGLLVGGALGYGLGYITPRPYYGSYYGPTPYYYQPYPYYPPFRPF